MPHKRAKKSKRDQERSGREFDVAPQTLKLESESIPKSMARVLNAEKTHKEYREKRRRDEVDDDGGSKRKRTKTDQKNLEILPGESLANFNRRVEDTMRPTLQTVRHAANRHAKAPQQSQNDEDASPPPPVPTTAAPKPRDQDFARPATVKRLNDIVQAPPDLARNRFATKAARKLAGREQSSSVDVVSPAHKRMMELEREKAIQRYRALKDYRQKRQEGQSQSS